MNRKPERFEAGDARLYRIPLDLFPGLTGYAHLAVGSGFAVLIDVGSGFGESNEQLEAGMNAVAASFGESTWSGLTHVLISHGHIDHYGGLSFVRRLTTAPVGIHEFDRGVLTDYERRLEAMAVRLRTFLTGAGVAQDELSNLMDLYLFTKQLFQAQEVDFVVRKEDSRLGPLELLHVPGHCPGQLVARLGDLLLTSDHVLPDVTPHMAPRALARHTGLAAYLGSLDRLELWGGDARLGLGGHGPPILDVAGRIEEIRAHHEARLGSVLGALSESASIADVTNRLFPSAGGYHRLLALEEVGAHVEFLSDRGWVRCLTSGDRNGVQLYGAVPGGRPVALRTV